jgi:hypothetical protein
MPAKHYPHKPASNDDLGHGRTVVHYPVSLASSLAILPITSISIDPVENAPDTAGPFLWKLQGICPLQIWASPSPPTAGSGRALGATRPEPARLSPSPASRLRPQGVTIADAGSAGSAAAAWPRWRVRGMAGKEEVKGGAGAEEWLSSARRGDRPCPTRRQPTNPLPIARAFIKRLPTRSKLAKSPLNVQNDRQGPPSSRSFRQAVLPVVHSRIDPRASPRGRRLSKGHVDSIERRSHSRGRNERSSPLKGGPRVPPSSPRTPPR